jgi:hypothetical protein
VAISYKRNKSFFYEIAALPTVTRNDNWRISFAA